SLFHITATSPTEIYTLSLHDALPIYYAKTHNKKVHFLGLVSDGGVHSHIQHLFGLLEAARNQEVHQVFVHAFTDGRDVDPQSGRSEEHTSELQSRENLVCRLLLEKKK